MTRSILIFLGMFITGAVLALVARAALFKPHATHESNAAGGGDYAPMVSNALTPAKSDAAPAASTAPAKAPAATRDAHAGHAHVTPPSDQPVNTLCAICGMDVDPKLPTAQYQGKTIGFGCRMCPPKFKADPDRWGPLYLKNETVKR